MSIVEIFIYPFVLCCLFNIVIITFPEAYKKTPVRKKINILLLVSSSVYCLIFIVLIIINKFCNIPKVEMDFSLLLIPLIAIIIFAANIYYPAIRISAITNQNKCRLAEELYSLMIDYRFGTTDVRQNTITDIVTFMKKHDKELKNTSEIILLHKLIEQSTTSTYKAPEKLIETIENTCLNTINDANGQMNPFSHICLISSFCLSSLLTILLAYITL